MLILIFIWAIAANWLAYNKGFYHFPKRAKTLPQITHFQLFTAFGLYLLISYFLTRVLVVFVVLTLKRNNPELTSLPISFVTGLQMLIMLLLFLSLQWFFSQQNSVNYRRIWKNQDHTPCFPLAFDFGLGALTWCMSFPIVTIISDLVDRALKAFTGFEHYEQNAVRFVKLASDSPISLLFALFSVLVMAPLTEEFLFRGVLQTYFKKRLGPPAAILLTALLFAFFHFSFNQGFGNVTLISTLFILGGFLGFLYERQGSLWAPIGLHVAFNAVSALRILFLPELS